MRACALLAAMGAALLTAGCASPGAEGGGSAPEAFDTPEHAASALVDAAGRFDEGALIAIFGDSGEDIVLTGEQPQDRERAAAFAAEARQNQTVSIDSNNGRAYVIVGSEQWPFPVPIVKHGSRWSFDANAGRAELLYRRIGANELDAIQVCRRYVAAQEEYALQARKGYEVNQYAQRIVSTPGKHDGLVWQNGDGSWGGPLGEEVAQAIQRGYTTDAQPYRGYYYKILTGQGPAADLGEMDFLVKGVMIGGFALVASPAEYRVTGVNTFIVSYEGIVYQKDLGPETLQRFQGMERYNPDSSWTEVQDPQ